MDKPEITKTEKLLNIIKYIHHYHVVALEKEMCLRRMIEDGT